MTNTKMMIVTDTLLLASLAVLLDDHNIHWPPDLPLPEGPDFTIVTETEHGYIAGEPYRLKRKRVIPSDELARVIHEALEPARPATIP